MRSLPRPYACGSVLPHALCREGARFWASALLEGSLVVMKFNAEGNGHEVAREISILAFRGAQYTFVGQVLHIDLRTGLLVLSSSTDHKTYEIYLSHQRLQTIACRWVPWLL